MASSLRNGGEEGVEGGFPGGALVRNLPANVGDACSIPGQELGGGDGSPFQYSCLQNSVDKGAWRTTVHGVTKTASGSEGGLEAKNRSKRLEKYEEENLPSGPAGFLRYVITCCA